MGGRRRRNPDQFGVGHHRPEHDPRPHTGHEEEAVLPEPADTGPVGGRPVDQGVVVTDHGRPPSVGPQALGHQAEGGPQVAVVVVAGVLGDSARRPLSRWFTAGGGSRRGPAIVPCRDDEGPGALEDASGVRRALGVAVGELHPTMEAPGLALAQRAARVPEDLGGGHTSGHASGPDGEGDEFLG